MAAWCDQGADGKGRGSRNTELTGKVRPKLRAMAGAGGRGVGGHERVRGSRFKPALEEGLQFELWEDASCSRTTALTTHSPLSSAQPAHTCRAALPASEQRAARGAWAWCREEIPAFRRLLAAGPAPSSAEPTCEDPALTGTRPVACLFPVTTAPSPSAAEEGRPHLRWPVLGTGSQGYQATCPPALGLPTPPAPKRSRGGGRLGLRLDGSWGVQLESRGPQCPLTHPDVLLPPSSDHASPEEAS